MSHLQILFDLLRSRRAIERASVAAMQNAGLTLAQTEVLFAIRNQGPMRQHQLARTLVVTTGNVVQLVDKLAERNLVVRREVADDRRANQLELTDQGTRAVEGLVEQLNVAASRLMKDTSTDDAQVAAGVLAKLVAVAHDW